LTNSEIVDILSRDRMVEKMIEHITRSGANDPDSLPDLAQDIYLSLMGDSHLDEVYGEGHIKYYISRIIMNNICSSTSRYYRTYIWPKTKLLNIDDGDYSNISE